MMLPVAGSWGSVLAKLIPLALVISLSPITVIPAVLVLQARRPRPTSLAFLTGWLLGLVGLTAAFTAGSGLVGHLHKAPPSWASWLRVVIGTALIAFGIYKWATRHRPSESPGWMRSFSKMTPARAGLTGAALTVVRPEVLLLCLAAGVGIGTGGFSGAGEWVVGAIFVALAASSVAIPIVGYLAAGHRLDDTLVRVKDWMELNHAALLAAVFVVIGLMVLYNGIHAL
jgi:hypothetical protein